MKTKNKLDAKIVNGKFVKYLLAHEKYNVVKFSPVCKILNKTVSLHYKEEFLKSEWFKAKLGKIEKKYDDVYADFFKRAAENLVNFILRLQPDILVR